MGMYMCNAFKFAQEYGDVKSCRVLFDHNGVSKQVAFVQFDTNQQALDSIAALHNKEVQIPCTKMLSS